MKIDGVFDITIIKASYIPYFGKMLENRLLKLCHDKSTQAAFSDL